MRRNLRDTLPAVAVTVGLTVAGQAVAPTAHAQVTRGATAVGEVPAGEATAGDETAAEVPVESVLAVSVDGLKPWAIRTLDPERAPVLHRLMAEGASTLNARTARELTDTLPNHTSMITSRRINATRDGHGVTWNDDRRRPRTVHAAAGERVGSVFSRLGAAGRDSALFASKTKFRLFNRSWPGGIDRFEVREHNGRLVRLVRADLREHSRDFRFVHLSQPDVVGHAKGFRSSAYLDAVEYVDTLVGRLLATLENRGLSQSSVLVLTADHGGTTASHREPTKLANYRIPFMAWGANVAKGADLYALNPDYADPGRRRTGYATQPPPVRNGSVANLVAGLLGLSSVGGSELNAAQDLDFN